MSMFKELSLKRSSIRKYTPEVPSRALVEEVLQTAQLAPSAVNKQPWRVLVVASSEAIEVVRKAYPRPWFEAAPIYVLLLADHRESWKRPCDGKDHADIDVSIFAEHLTLAAAEKGLASCWVCNFDPEILRQGFDLPSYLEPMVIFPLGYPQEETLFNAPKNRKTLSEFVEWI